VALIQIVAGLILTVTSAFILGLVWYTDRPEPRRAAPPSDREDSDYSRAA
jgi:hypothetical protein